MVLSDGGLYFKTAGAHFTTYFNVFGLTGASISSAAACAEKCEISHETLGGETCAAFSFYSDLGTCYLHSSDNLKSPSSGGGMLLKGAGGGGADFYARRTAFISWDASAPARGGGRYTAFVGRSCSNSTSGLGDLGV